MSKTKYQCLTERLQSHLRSYHGDWWIDYRHNIGWYAVPDFQRHFDDDGEFLGRNYKQACEAIPKIF